MGIRVTENTTYEAVISPTYPDGRVITLTGVHGLDYAAASQALEQFGTRCQTHNEIVRLMLGASGIIAWLVEHLPLTRIEPETRSGETVLVATFASETDAVAFKTRWG